MPVPHKLIVATEVPDQYVAHLAADKAQLDILAVPDSFVVERPAPKVAAEADNRAQALARIERRILARPHKASALGAEQVLAGLLPYPVCGAARAGAARLYCCLHHAQAYLPAGQHLASMCYVISAQVPQQH